MRPEEIAQRTPHDDINIGRAERWQHGQVLDAQPDVLAFIRFAMHELDGDRDDQVSVSAT